MIRFDSNSFERYGTIHRIKTCQKSKKMELYKNWIVSKCFCCIQKSNSNCQHFFRKRRLQSHCNVWAFFILYKHQLDSCYNVVGKQNCTKLSKPIQRSRKKLIHSIFLPKVFLTPHKIGLETFEPSFFCCNHWNLLIILLCTNVALQAKNECLWVSSNWKWSLVLT